MPQALLRTGCGLRPPLDRTSPELRSFRCGGLAADELCDLVTQLVTAGVAYLAVRVRDGIGLVGPLVVPGVTSGLGSYKRG